MILPKLNREKGQFNNLGFLIIFFRELTTYYILNQGNYNFITLCDLSRLLLNKFVFCSIGKVD